MRYKAVGKGEKKQKNCKNCLFLREIIVKIEKFY